MARILIVEDEQHLADGLRFNLEAEGHTVAVAGDGEAALAALGGEGGAATGVVILDVMLPGKNGFAVATELRQAGNYVPILMLTARGRPEDVLLGFEAGADDYLPKPFELAILLARVKGLLRRKAWATSPRENGASVANGKARGGGRAAFRFADKTIDFAALELRVGKKTYQLTAMEADLLGYLIDKQGQVVARRAILEDVWGLHEDTDTRAIDNFIARLRKYIERTPAAPKHLLTVRGVGYKFVTAPGKDD